MKEASPRRRTQVSVERLQPDDFMRVDRRTIEGRFVVRRAAEHELQLGRSASPRERSLIRRLTMLELQAEIIEQRLLESGEAMPEIYLRIVDRIDRLAKALGLRPQGREIRPLAEYVARAQESPQEPGDSAGAGRSAPHSVNGSQEPGEAAGK